MPRARNRPPFRESAARAKRVRLTAHALVVELLDGRVLSVPLEWYPRLAHGSPRERRQWQLIGSGVGIHWPALDEDISVAGLIRGLPSNERPDSVDRWLTGRRRAAKRRR